MTDTIDPVTRRAVARDICRQEGHGQLVDVTTELESAHTVFICNRGCGVTPVRIDTACTLAELDAWTKRHYPGYRVWLSSGVFDLEPPS